MIPVLLQALCTWTDLDRQTCLIWWSALGRATWSRPVELRHLLALREAQFPTLQGLRRPDVGYWMRTKVSKRSIRKWSHTDNAEVHNQWC
jgi:hypothetical protein